jgi:hypothetical protein
MPIAVLILAVIAGLVLLLVGLRGRVIDDHPLCRRCGFDLTGKPQDSDRCAECGTDVTTPQAVRIGHRQRRSRPLWAGVALLVPACLVLVVSAVAVIGQVDLMPWKPAWLLQWDAEGGDSRTSDRAYAELTRRLKAGSLSKDRIQSLVADAMRRQVDPALAWSNARGDFVADAYVAGQITNELWVRYVRQGIKLELQARPTVRVGDPIPTGIAVRALRIGRAAASIDFKGTELSAPGATTRPWAWTDGGADFGSGGGGWHATSPDLGGAATASLPPGPYPIVGSLRISVLNSKGGQPVGQYDVDVSALVMLASNDETIEYFTTDESQRRAVEAAVEIPEITALSSGGVDVRMSFRSPPIRLTGRVFLRTPDGRQISLNSWIDVPERQGRTGYGFGARVKDDLQGAATVDFIFHPDLDMVKRSVNPAVRWGDDIVIRNVPISRTPQNTRARPATMSAQ